MDLDEQLHAVSAALHKDLADLDELGEELGEESPSGADSIPGWSASASSGSAPSRVP